MISADVRRTVRTLYRFACGYCGVTETEVGALLTIDHFQPVDAGGSDDIDNLVYACHACNLFKSSAWNPSKPGILHPLRMDMTLHLRQLPDGTVQGLTTEGMLHIDALHLNRAPMVERRRMRYLIKMLIGRDEELRTKELEQDQDIQRKKRAILKAWRKARQ